MPRIKLAYWHGGHAPGDEVDVSDEELAALQRDGRVAEVLPSGGGHLAPDSAEAVGESGTEASAEPPPSAGRKRR